MDALADSLKWKTWVLPIVVYFDDSSSIRATALLIHISAGHPPATSSDERSFAFGENSKSAACLVWT